MLDEPKFGHAIEEYQDFVTTLLITIYAMLLCTSLTISFVFIDNFFLISIIISCILATPLVIGIFVFLIVLVSDNYHDMEGKLMIN